MKKSLLFLFAAAFAVNGYAQEPVKTFEATWDFYDEDNDEYATPDATAKRTLNLYADNSYELVNAFGSENDNDVLRFFLTEKNVFFLGLYASDGAKYIYYSDGDDDYSYIYDAECVG